MARVLLAVPNFPVPNKSLNHKDFLPIGLMKLATWRKQSGDEVSFSVGDLRTDFVPDEVYVTSLFTYWAGYVRDTVTQCRMQFPNAHITVGGIYASLQPSHCREFTGCDSVWEGVHPEAESCSPDYTFFNTDFQIVHASRGCIRRCPYCGTYDIEPEFKPKSTIREEIFTNHVVFYDNNLLANPHIENILSELAEIRVNGRRLTCESQSGFDGRILLQKPRLAQKLKDAGFKSPRIAWDGGIELNVSIAEQIRLLVSARFAPKDIQVFMIYNHELPPDSIKQKVEQCFRWGVQVSDCRYRPLDRFEDGYKSYKKSQSDNEYYVHKNWTDTEVRAVRREVRKNNICIRYRIPRERYAKDLERFSRGRKREIATRLGIDAEVYSDEELAAMNRAWVDGLPVDPPPCREWSLIPDSRGVN